MLARVREGTFTAAVSGAALAIAAILMLGPGGARPIHAAQIWGGPLAEDSTRAGFRLVLLERLHRISSPVANRALALKATASNGARGEWEGTTGPDGTAEATVTWDRPARPPVTIHVRDAAGRTVSEGSLPERPDGWGPGRSSHARLAGSTQGELAIGVALRRGVLAPPFREELVIEVRRDGRAVAGARLGISAPGAVLDMGNARLAGPEVTSTTDGRGQATLGLTPMSHDVDIAVEASSHDMKGHFEAKLPVVPGAMWLEPAPPDATVRTIVSPAPRTLAHVSVATATARLFGAVVELTPDGRGHATGHVDLSAILPELGGDDAYLTVASSPAGEGAGTVGWPLSPAADPFDAASFAIRDVLLLDGLPRAIEVDSARRTGAARFASLVLAAAMLCQGALLLRAARAGAGHVELEMAGAETLQVPTKPSLAPLLIALTVTALAFAAVGLLAFLQSTG